MVEARNYNLLQSKYKAISALFPYAVWQERDGKPEVLDAFLSAARASKEREFTWRRAGGFSAMQLSEASPRAIILITPHILHLIDGGDLLQHWATAASAVPHTEEVAQSVVDALLQFAYEGDLLPYITVDMWSWLKTQPSFPPICWGPVCGSYQSIVKAVQDLKDIEILKSYLLVVWSGWNPVQSFDEICALIHGHFGEVGMGHHRADLIQRLDHILGEWDQGLDYLRSHNPGLATDDFLLMGYQYGKLKDILLEMNVKAITCMSDRMAVLFCTLTQMDVHRIPCNICVCTPFPISIASHLETCTFPIFPPLHQHLHKDFCTYAYSFYVSSCLLSVVPM